MIDDPKVVGDSIRGVMRYASGGPTVVVALSDVQRVETTHIHADTTILNLGIALSIVLALGTQYKL